VSPTRAFDGAEYRALLSEYWALLIEYRALSIEYRAIWIRDRGAALNATRK